MASPRIFNAKSVRSVLTWPLVIEAVEEAFKAAASKKRESTASFAPYSRRVKTIVGNDVSKELLTMPASVHNYELEDRRDANNTPTVPAAKIKYSTLACKFVTSFRGNMDREPPVPRILANIALFSTETGQLECLMDGTDITAWRTAAASIIATKYLYLRRDGDFATRPIQVAIVGCGVQGQSHALGMCANLNVSVIRLWNRTIEKAEALAEQLRNSVTAETCVYVEQTAAAAVSEADVVCIATSSPVAVINAAMFTKSDLHINAVGCERDEYGEVAKDIYDKGYIFVDSIPNALVELDTLNAKVTGEIGLLLAIDRDQYLSSMQGITIFQSRGLAAQDATVAQAVFEVLKRATD